MKTPIRTTGRLKPPLGERFSVEGSFREHLSGCNLVRLGASRDTVYALDRDLRIRGYNDAFHKLGLREGGRGWLRRHGLGSSVLEVFSGFYAEHYGRVYRRCLETGESHGALYGGPTPTDYRWFRETVRPLSERAGLLIRHHLLQVVPIAEANRYDADVHRSRDGLVLLCCHCQRVRNCRRSDLWEWVPNLKTQVDEELSHGICPRCLDTYYREFLPVER